MDGTLIGRAAAVRRQTGRWWRGRGAVRGWPFVGWQGDGEQVGVFKEPGGDPNWRVAMARDNLAMLLKRQRLPVDKRALKPNGAAWSWW